MSNWYAIGYNYLYICLDKLTNDILNTCDIIPKKYSDTHLSIYYENDTLDIKLLMLKLIYCKKLYIGSKLKSSFKLPPYLVYYAEKYQNNILEFPNTLKEYECHHNMIPENLPLSLEKVLIKSLNNTFYNIPSNVTELDINVIEIENILWPINLKRLSLSINEYTTNSIGILPYGLEYFIFYYKNYEYPIVLPQTVTSFIFYNYGDNVSEYKFTDSLNGLPDSIEYLVLNYKSCSRIFKLPKACKDFKYWNCPNDILDILKTSYPNVNITNK